MADSISATRECKVCEVEKPLIVENFRKHFRKGKWYWEYECRSCTRKKIKAARDADVVAARARERVRYYANLELHRALGRNGYRKNRVNILARVSKKRAENGDKMREADREYAKRWRKNNKFKSNQWAAKQRAVKKKVKIGKIVKADIDALFGKQKGKCAICFKTIKGKWHIDHIVPLAKGGPHELKNFQLTHPICNIRKRHIDPIEFMQKRGFLL